MSEENAREVHLSVAVRVPAATEQETVLRAVDHALGEEQDSADSWSDWELVSVELEAAYRARQNVHPGIGTTDDGDDLSRLNHDMQVYLSGARGNPMPPPMAAQLMSRLNKLVNPNA